MTKATANKTAYNTQLVGFTTELREFEGKAVLEMTFTNADKDTWKLMSYTKQFWVLKSEGLSFEIAKAQRAFAKAEPEYKSFSIYGEKGLIKSLQANKKITAEL